MKKLSFSIILFFAVCFCQEYKTLNCVLHVHSNFSGTEYTIEDIAKIAKQNNIDVVVLTDHLVQKVEFGIWPVRKIVKKYKENASVLTFGVNNYLDTIKKVSNQYNIIIIPGVEVTPHYFWTTEEEMLVAKNLHKHMLVINCSKPEQLLSLPVIHNKNVFSVKHILATVVLLILLILSFKIRLKFLSFIILLVVVSQIFYLYDSQFHQYKNYYDKPYQSLIDWVNTQQNMFIIWAHPEASNYQNKVVVETIKKLKIATQTIPYPESLLTTVGYTGFSIFAEGYRKVGNPSGLWDFLLKEYLYGKREKPVWCYSEADFGETKDPLYLRKNVLFVKEKTYNDVITALETGSFYSLWRDEKRELVLEQPTINAKELVFGKTYRINTDNVTIEFMVRFSDDMEYNAKVYIIRNSEVVFCEEKKLPTKVVFTEQKPKANRSYYRIYIESNYPHMLATNPVFVE